MKSPSPLISSRNLLIQTFAIIAGFWVADLQAASRTWSSNDTTANWSSTTNWGGLTAPGVTGSGGSVDAATFSTAVGSVGTSGNPVIFDSAWSLGSIVFDTSSAGPFFIGTTGGNMITANGSVTAGIIINSSVTSTQTVNAPISIRFNSGVFGLVNNADSSALLNVGGGITSVGTGGTTTLTLGGSNTGNNTYSGVLGNGVSGATVALKKSGSGNWVLTGANTYTGATTLQGGNLILDYTAPGAPASNIISSSSALTLGAASTASSQILTLNGKSATATTQTLGNVTFSAASGFGSGSSHINLNAGASSGTLVLTLGTLSAKVGGATLDFALSSGASVKVGTASAVTGAGSGLFANVVTINGTDFATNDGNAANTLVGLSTISGAYDTSTTVSASLTKALDVQSNTSITSSATLPAVRFNQAGAATVTISSGQTATLGGNGGILVTSNVGANITTITGGSLRGINGRDLSLIQNNVTARLQVDSTIVSNGASGLTKSGQGLAVLTGANVYTGATYVNEGTLLVSNTSDSGTGTGSLSVASGATLGGTGTVTPGTGNAITVSGAVAPGASGSIGTLTFNGGSTASALATFSSGASFAFDLNGTSVTSDRLSLVSGAAGDFVFNNNIIAFTLSGSLANGQTYTIFSADAADAYSGLTLDGSNHVTAGLTFSGLGGSFQSNSYISKIGNDLVLTAVPEPATLLYVFSGLGLLFGIQSLRRRQTGL